MDSLYHVVLSIKKDLCRLSLWVVLVVLHACAQTNPQSAHSPTATSHLVSDVAQTTSVPLLTKTIPATQSATIAATRLSSTAPSSPAPSVEPANTPPSPLVSAARTFPHAWSPNSQFLAYWTFTSDQVKADYTYPPGTLNFINAKTGEVCESVLQVGYGYFANQFTWFSDGKVLFVTENGDVKIGLPCSDKYDTITDHFPTRIRSIASHNSDYSVLLFHTVQGLVIYVSQVQSTQIVDAQVKGEGISWSPSSERFAVTATGEMPEFIAKTTVVETKTGNVLDVTEWKHFDGEGRFGGPLWINENQFLIAQTLDRGPLLVNIKQDVIAIAPRFFGLAPEPQTLATAVGMRGTLDFHIAVSGLGPKKDSHILLYHSAKGQIEELPFPDVQGFSFSPDGQAFIALDRRLPPFQLWLRKVSPMADSLVPLLKEKLDVFPVAWSPKENSFAIKTSTGISVILLSNGVASQSWRTDNSVILPALWSPNAQFLAFAEGEGDLFIVPVSDR